MTLESAADERERLLERIRLLVNELERLERAGAPAAQVVRRRVELQRLKSQLAAVVRHAAA